MKKMLILVLFFLTACQQEEAELQEANEELPFHVLHPVELSEEWHVREVIYEDEIVIVIYEDENNGVIELIQDQHIQGLDHEVLRDFLRSGQWSREDAAYKFDQPFMINDFVGEWTLLDKEDSNIQYTFMRQFDLFQEPAAGASYYQVIGKDVPAEKLEDFVASLNEYTG